VSVNNENCSSSNSRTKKNNLDRIFCLIEQRTVSTDDFNNLIESLPKHGNERVIRHVRSPASGVSPPTKKPGEKTPKRAGDTSPMKTRRGRNAVRDRGKENKENSEEFRIAAEFLLRNNCRPIREFAKDLVDINKRPLLLLVSELCNRTNTGDLNKTWLMTLKNRLS